MFKFIGFLIGVFSGGFWGALGGLLIGGIIDSIINAKSRVRVYRHYGKQDFTETLLIFTAYVVKSDNNYLLRSEMMYIKNYLIRTLGPDAAVSAIYQLNEILDNTYDIKDICFKLNNKATIHEKLLILQFLFGLAASDGECSPLEIDAIRNISDWSGINRYDFESLKAMYMGYQSQSNNYQNSQTSSNRRHYDLESDYKILEISSSATDEEVKKAYREAAKKHHPDKVNHLGEDIRKAAEEKFSKLNEAYDRIKKSRGMN